MFDDPIRRFEIDGLIFDASPRPGFAHLRLRLAMKQAREEKEQSDQNLGYAHSGRRWKREASLLQEGVCNLSVKTPKDLIWLRAKPYGLADHS